jgi:hypothetical protein
VKVVDSHKHVQWPCYGLPRSQDKLEAKCPLSRVHALLVTCISHAQSLDYVIREVLIVMTEFNVQILGVHCTCTHTTIIPSMDGSIFSNVACPSCEVSALRAVMNFIPPSFLVATHFSRRVSILSVSFRVESVISSSSLEVSKSCSFSLGTRAERSMYRTQSKKVRNE